MAMRRHGFDGSIPAADYSAFQCPYKEPSISVHWNRGCKRRGQKPIKGM
jgi:hypothetical protein